MILFLETKIFPLLSSVKLRIRLLHEFLSACDTFEPRTKKGIYYHVAEQVIKLHIICLNVEK